MLVCVWAQLLLQEQTNSSSTMENLQQHATAAASISSERMHQILADLAAQQQRLATDLVFFKQHAADLQAMRQHFINKSESYSQLLQCNPKLLEHLARVTAAALQQLPAQLSEDIEVSKTVALLCQSLNAVLLDIQVRGCQVGIPADPTDTANLRILQGTGERAVSAQAHKQLPGLLLSNAQVYTSLEDIQPS